MDMMQRIRIGLATALMTLALPAVGWAVASEVAVELDPPPVVVQDHTGWAEFRAPHAAWLSRTGEPAIPG